MLGSQRKYRACLPGLPGRPRPAVARRGPPWAAAIAASLAVLPASAADGGVRAGHPQPGGQFRIGLLQHDLNGYGGSENGVDLTVELRGPALQGAFWRGVFSPRPHIGVNLNDSGATSSLYAGLAWMGDFGETFYVSADFGGAVHNGKLHTAEPDRAELGSRVLFREALEVGLRFGERWRAGLRVDHFSNANLASQNDGITDFGVVVSRNF